MRGLCISKWNFIAFRCYLEGFPSLSAENLCGSATLLLNLVCYFRGSFKSAFIFLVFLFLYIPDLSLFNPKVK